ncbi:phosphoethanolamine transferase [Acinetobacter larvae]|uniref:Lipid A phosphoethanolamine transferase n=1 Tax=Acinetobacter larvae TaxID=1789224 RepID=A0A1B2M1P2_9GAMM|nr:phosphoethanolamine--lipid A transferase [Acinetobacter larvae]AOA59071.1 lipid A phosphoethanolamine transferase [Acinetobacter larvae]
MQKNLQKRQNKRITLSLGSLNLILAIWIAGVLNLTFFQHVYALTPYQGIKAYLFIAATVVILVAFYNFIFQFLQWRRSFKWLAVILLLLAGLSAYFVSSLGIVISADQIQNIMQTDHTEARDLLSWRLIGWFLLMVLLPILLLLFMVSIKEQTYLQIVRHKLVNALLSLACILALLFIFYVDYAAIFREHRSLKGLISPQNTIAASYSYIKHKIPQKNQPLLRYGLDAHLLQKVVAGQKAKLLVIVVGETARAESFSLNGYAQDTNPLLAAQTDLINFSQASSCGTATAVSVPCMFSGMPRVEYDEQLASHREGLLDIAQRAGYKVTWIDNNSGCKGTCDRVERYVIPAAITQKWCQGKECLDGILIDSLTDYLKQIAIDDTQPRLLVLHQLGSHGPAYYKRIPPAFRKFKPTCDTNAIQGCSRQQLLNSYDNTIYYTDYILNQLIEVLKQQSSHQTALWYLSDHGESTGEKGMYLHGAPYRFSPSQQTHIPMLIWFSSNWQQSNPGQYGCLQKLKDHAVSQDNLFPTTLSLLNIESKVIDRHFDLMQQCSTTESG